LQKGKNNLDKIAKTGYKIIGFGNKFRTDDGFGPTVIEELENSDLSQNDSIEIIDGGTSGSDLIFHLKECPNVIIIDALDAGQPKGSIACIKEKDIESFVKKITSLSLHDLDLADILKITRAMKLKTDITIIGINPLSTDFGDTMSSEVRKRMPEVISMVKDMVKDI